MARGFDRRATRREAGGSSLGGMATAAKGAAAQRVRGALGLGTAAERGRDKAWSAINRGPASSASSSPAASAAAAAGSADAAPAWAQRLSSEQTSRHRRQLALHTIGSGSSSGAGATPDIKERD